MKRTQLCIAAAVIGLAAVSTAVPALAAVSVRNNSAMKATDFHITFAAPVNLKDVSASNFNKISQGATTSDVNMTGGSVNPGDSFNINGMNEGTALQAANAHGIVVTAWNWTPAAITETPAVQYTDPTTGSGSYIDLPTLGGHGLVLYTTPVPEPAAWVLLIGGLGLTGLVLRRRAPHLA